MENIAVILKWATVGSQIFEGIVSMINTLIDEKRGAITAEHARIAIQDMDDIVSHAVAEENAMFSDTKNGDDED